MNELVYIRKNDVFTDTLVIAEGTGNEHRAVAVLIKRYKKQFAEIGKICFKHLKCRKYQGRPMKVYQLNEPQASFLITLLKNSEAVVAFKLELVKQFYAMRKLLLEKQTQRWQETRKIGKMIRSIEADYIKALAAYAEAQGSKNPRMLYMAYTKLANSVAGVEDRERANTLQLNNLLLAERVIDDSIAAGMREGKHYKDIYAECKARLAQFREIARLSQSYEGRRERNGYKLESRPNQCGIKAE